MYYAFYDIFINEETLLSTLYLMRFILRFIFNMNSTRVSSGYYRPVRGEFKCVKFKEK
ncbi:hypothetical protein TUMSATVNIG3_16590 [Vibrio nigripulchritudo]|nr:hypothetical protein TUMSATVNIG2_16180 [Vibrio nigripulchritudo]BDU42861.1 hypothetical protein TUMSATVNIG3_16590 [Vibrio nigripulchritudo]